MSWNPRTPAVIGLEYMPHLEDVTGLKAVAEAVGIKQRSSAAETIDKCSLYLAADVAPSSKLIVDVYELEDAVASAVTTKTFRPNEDVVKTNVSNQAGSTTNIFQAIDETQLDTLDSIFRVTSGACEYSCRMGVGIGNLAGRRITKVQLVWVSECDVVNIGASIQITPYVNIGSVKYNAAVRTVGNSGPYSFTDTWVLNPATGLPWTIAELEAFDTVDEFGWSAPDTPGFRLYQAYLVVSSVAENRVATGGVTPASGWQEVNLGTPTGGATWSKLNGQDYLWVARLAAAGPTEQVRYFDSGDAVTHGSYESYLPTVVDASGRLSALGAPMTRGYPLIITTSTPSTSVDSLPYASRLEEVVRSGRTVEQEITGVAGDFGLVRCLIAQQAESADGDLLVKVKRRSDNVQLGSTLTIKRNQDLIPNPAALKVFQASLGTPATLVAGTQYYLEFSSTATDGRGWVVAVLDTEGQGSTLGFGGTTDAATVAGVEDLDQDVCVTLSTAPAPPAGFTATVV